MHEGNQIIPLVCPWVLAAVTGHRPALSYHDAPSGTYSISPVYHTMGKPHKTNKSKWCENPTDLRRRGIYRTSTMVKASRGCDVHDKPESIG